MFETTNQYIYIYICIYDKPTTQLYSFPKTQFFVGLSSPQWQVNKALVQ